ncbi:g567 [Coccomyxa viridis]|uniref:G567 protein n=1 Tax=Coccomyxa viridis TaxID=1274662 RepID=A0ABP1FG60_9CHLO
MQVLYGDTVRAILQKPGYRGFYEQHVLQQEIFSWMITRRPIPSRTWLSDVLGFVEGITKDYAHTEGLHKHEHDEGKMEMLLIDLLSRMPWPMHLADEIEPYMRACLWQSYQGELGPFIEARHHIFFKQDMYVSLASRQPQKQAVPVAAPEEAIEARPAFPYQPAPTHTHSQRGTDGRQTSLGLSRDSQQQDASQEALTELQQKFEGFQTDLDLIKKHLKVPVTDSCNADWTTSGTSSSAYPPSACIWVIGGHDGSEFLSDSRTFHTRREDWQAVADLSSPLMFSAAASLHSHIYVFGGSTPADEDEGFTERAQRFDIEDGTWLPLAPMSMARGSLAVSELGGAFFCVGGGTPLVQYNLAERYDPVSDRWTILKPMGTPRYTLASATLMSSMICVGGFDGDKHLASSELYDPRMGRWIQLSSMASPRGSLSVCSISDRELLAIGGYSNKAECIGICEILDLRMAKWRPTGALAEPRACGAAVGGGQVYAIGGLERDTSIHHEAVEVFDPQQQAWSGLKLDTQQSAPFKRAFFAAVATIDSLA